MSLRPLFATLLLLTACGTPPSPPAAGIAADAGEELTPLRVSELRFNDYPLQAIASKVVRDARAKGIEVVSCRHRVDGLLRLEAMLGRSTAALDRVNSLTLQLIATDRGKWAQLRTRAAQEFAGRDDEAARRVQDLLSRWQREKAEAALRHLSSNYHFFIGEGEWERRFHDFAARRPADAATWGWLVLRDRADAARQQYGRADAETAYRFYLESNRFGSGRDARRVFSVPGVEIETAR